jgi:hypothetical protein
VIIFKRFRKRPQFQGGLPSGSIAVMSDSGWSNQDFSLDSLKHFLKFKSEDRVLLTSHRYASHNSYIVVTFCKDHDKELIGLIPIALIWYGYWTVHF